MWLTLQHAELSVPAPGRYEIVLTDGTALNAAPEGPKATDLVLAGLALCGLRSLESVLERMRLEVGGVTLRVEAERAPEPPRVFTRVRMTWRIAAGSTPPDRIHRALDLAEKYCTVYNVLSKSVAIEVERQIDAG